jgi:hypothetical protein
MKINIFNRPWRASPVLRGAGATVLSALLLVTANLRAQTNNGVIVGTLGGGGYTPFYGYVDGNTATVTEFHTPIGLAMDSTGDYLHVADRDNNAIRVLDLAAGETFTLVPNAYSLPNVIASPVGVVLDADDNLYVLNRGNGNNGSVVEFDYYGDLVATNAVGLVNANAIALDPANNIYVTAGNSLIQIPPGGVKTTVATVAAAGASLQGLVVMDSGLIAACDSGRHGIYLINPLTGVITTNTGFNGPGDDYDPANRGVTKAHAQFNQPTGLAKAGNNMLVVADYGNNRVKVVNAVGTVTNLYGVSSSLWYTGPGSSPGWSDGAVFVPDAIGDVEARAPNGILFAPNGLVYVTEDYYHLIRKVTANLPPLPPPQPPPPPVPAPAIGWVDFTIPPAAVVSVLRTNSPFIFHNDVTIAILGTDGAETHFTSGVTGSSIPNPDANIGGTPPGYFDGMFVDQVQPSIVPPQPDVTVKAMGFAPGRQSSYVVSARFQFKTANPVITGANAALFTVTDVTTNAQMWYTIDGTAPTNSPPSLGPITNGASLSLNGSSSLTFKIRAFRNNYQPSDPVTTVFSSANFAPNTISFGFASGEASSAFVGSPGQTFYAPVTLSVLTGTRMYSLQFNTTITSSGAAPAITWAPGAYGFQSMLMKPLVPIPTNYPSGFALYTNIPPFMFVNGGFTNLEFINTNLNLLGVGWLERYAETNLYNTLAQNLITYSMAHDDLFPNPQQPNKVIVGGYNFRIPGTAQPGQQYQIQIGRPSATSDGVGAPGSDVYIDTPTTGSLAAGPINSIKNVTVGQLKYLVGDCAPFGWFNAGDFGNTNLDSSDVMQVFQSAIYSLNYPPPHSDFFDSMDSCGTLGVATPSGYWVPGATISDPATLNLLFDGDDTLIKSMAFGDIPQKDLDVCDVYVTFRRSLDPSLTWFHRFWTNGILAAEPVYPQPHLQSLAKSADAPLQPKLSMSFMTNPPSVNFAATDFTAAAGQTLQIPITAKIFGGYPLRVLMLNLTVQPLDGSPALTSTVQFAPNAALGTPAMTSSTGNGNYAATWLNSTIAGLTGTATLGTLTVTIPANAPSSAAYAIHFDHASASPNGIASFPQQTLTGLILLSDRSASIYGDGIPDSWRLRYFGTVNNILSQAAADADGDGASNWHEYVAGTDPTDSKSHLRVSTDQAVAQQGQDCVIHWPSVAGKHYLIERSTSLYGSAWTPVSTNTGSGADMEFHDTTGGNIRFYRVHVTP